MAKKETSKKTSKKSTTKKKVIKEVAEKIIESQEKVEVAEQDPPIEQEYLDAIIENRATVEGFIENKEPEYEPTAEQVEKTIEVMNGDPSVIIPSNDIELNKVETIEAEAFKDTFKDVKMENKRNSRIDRTFGYSWNGIEIDF
jgi:predicted methyltransferase